MVSKNLQMHSIAPDYLSVRIYLLWDIIYMYISIFFFFLLLVIVVSFDGSEYEIGKCYVLISGKEAWSRSGGRAA